MGKFKTSKAQKDRQVAKGSDVLIWYMEQSNIASDRSSFLYPEYGCQKLEMKTAEKDSRYTKTNDLFAFDKIMIWRVIGGITVIKDKGMVW